MLFPNSLQCNEVYITDSLHMDWLHEPLDPHCNIQLQTSFFKPKDSFKYQVVNCVPHTEPLSYLHIWMTSIGNPYAYVLHLFHWFCATQKVTKICRNIYLVHTITHDMCHGKTDLNSLADRGQKWALGKSSLTRICNKTSDIVNSDLFSPTCIRWTIRSLSLSYPKN